MKTKTIAAVAAAGAMAFANTNAMAADVMMPATTVAAVTTPAFSWSGPYIGAYGGYWFCCGPMLGVLGGYNHQVGDSFLVGFDASVGLWDFPTVSVESYFLARAGVILGERVLLYGGLGGAYDGTLVTAGSAGVEVAVGDSFTVRGEALVYDLFAPDLAIRGGFSFRFGN